MGQPVRANASTTCAGLANLAVAPNNRNAAVKPLMAHPVQIRRAEIAPAIVASNSAPFADSISFSFLPRTRSFYGLIGGPRVLDYLRRPYWEPHSDLGAESLGTHNRGFPEPSPRGDWRSWRIIQLMPNRSRT